MTKQEVPEAPYTFIFQVGVVDGKKVKYYWLGKHGKEKLKNAITKNDLLKTEETIKNLQRNINILEDIIGNDTIIKHFRQRILQRLKRSACHRSDLIRFPLWFERKAAFEQLLEEGMIIRATRGGWIKLANIEKEVKQ